jgi:hypothetical protein
MKPAQNEIKVYQQSLASLSHMNISDQKAFWCAISNVTDTYNNIIKLEHEYYNQQYIAGLCWINILIRANIIQVILLY